MFQTVHLSYAEVCQKQSDWRGVFMANNTKMPKRYQLPKNTGKKSSIYQIFTYFIRYICICVANIPTEANSIGEGSSGVFNPPPSPASNLCSRGYHALF